MNQLVLWNPAAGRADRLDWGQLRSLLGEPFELAVPQDSGEATRLAQEAVQRGFQRLWIAGGDGTLNQVINGVEDAPIVLGLIPCGTGNEWARELRLPPTRWKQAVARQMRSQPLPFDVGLVECPELNLRRRFLLMLGAGFDAEVVARIRDPRKRAGVPTYVLQAFKQLVATHPFHLQIDGQPCRAPLYLVSVCNAAHYALRFQLCPQADPKDQQLDLALCFQSAFWNLKLLVPALYFLLGKIDRSSCMEYRRLESVHLVFDRPVPFQLDGEYIGQVRELRVKIVPSAIRFLTG